MSKLPEFKSSRSRSISPSPDRSGKAAGIGKYSMVGLTDKDKGSPKRSFTREMKDRCWDMAEMVRGRDPNRWRRDTVGNIVFRGFTNCQGPLCYEFDHVKPYGKGPIQQNSRIAKPDKGHALDIPKTHVSIFNAAPLRPRRHTLTAEDHSRPQRRLHVDPCPTRDPLRPPTATSKILGNPIIGLAYK
ncbi:hypothetical protein Tco_1202193 [Tanacetum coccineum]